MRLWLCTLAIAMASVGAAPVSHAQGSTPLSIGTPGSDPLAFDSAELDANAGDDVVLTYTNDSSLPHNWHVFAGGDANAPSIAATPLNSGPGDVETVEFTAPSSPGSYYYQCDVHPWMNGALVIS